MRTYVPKLPNLPSPSSLLNDDDAEPVEPSLTRDSTEPELAPPVRPTPVGSPIGSPIGSRVPDPARSRKATLVSPIPALLAASMTELRDDKSTATPVPVPVRGEETSRFEAADQRALLMDGELDYDTDYEIDYVVEVVDTNKKK